MKLQPRKWHEVAEVGGSLYEQDYLDGKCPECGAEMYNDECPECGFAWEDEEEIDEEWDYDEIDTDKLRGEFVGTD